MSRAQVIAVLVAFVLAATAGGATALLRERDGAGAPLPLRRRLLAGAVVFVIAALLAVFAVTTPTWFAVYFVTWWVTLFAVLPFGVRSQEEGGAVVAGSDPGAPGSPALLRKAALTTAVSIVVFAIVVVVVTVFDVD